MGCHSSKAQVAAVSSPKHNADLRLPTLLGQRGEVIAKTDGGSCAQKSSAAVRDLVKPTQNASHGNATRATEQTSPVESAPFQQLLSADLHDQLAQHKAMSTQPKYIASCLIPSQSQKYGTVDDTFATSSCPQHTFGLVEKIDGSQPPLSEVRQHSSFDTEKCTHRSNARAASADDSTNPGFDAGRVIDHSEKGKMNAALPPAPTENSWAKEYLQLCVGVRPKQSISDSKNSTSTRSCF